MEASDPSGGARSANAALTPEFPDAIALAALIRTRQLSAGEAAEQAIANIEALNPKLNAVICRTYERSPRRGAGSAGGSGLGGVPFLVKDNATIAGVRLTCGSRALRDHVPNATAPFFAALESAGLVLLGVTNMPELGLIDGTENAFYGATRNPWQLDATPGGSSGGSAACVAAGIVPLAHGTDGGGSIRIPASHCGLFGLKASGGRLLAGRADTSAWPRLVDGVLSRSVRDTAMYLSLVENPDSGLRPLRFVERRRSSRLRMALMYEGAHGKLPHPTVRAAVEASAALCRDLGHVVEEVSLPVDLAQVGRAARQTDAVDVARKIEEIVRTKRLTRLEDGFEPRALGLREEALRGGSFEAQIEAAVPKLRLAAAAIDRFFEKWDVLLTPVVSDPSFKIGMRDQARFSFEALEEMLREHVAYTAVHNICGTTAMSVPLYWEANGLPIGSQFAARRGSEATLLELAYELEEARPWKARRPPLYAS